MRRAVVTLAMLSVMEMMCFGHALAEALPPEDVQRAGSSLPIEGQYAVSAAIGRDDSRYHSLDTAAGVKLENPAQSLRLVFSHDNATLQAGSLIWQIGLVSWGLATRAYPWKVAILSPATTGSKWITAT